MTPALKLRGKPFINDHFCHFLTDHTGSETKNIGIVVLTAHPGTVRLGTADGTHALYLVG